MKDGHGNSLSAEQEAEIRQQARPTREADLAPTLDAVGKIAQAHGVAVDAVETALMALRRGNGTMAQFSHPDFGGMVQWSTGGMSMVGDMFNDATKAKLNGVLQDLADALRRGDILTEEPNVERVQSGTGRSDWPDEFGPASTTGNQNDMRYAFFPSARRLIIEDGEKRTIYDTGEHNITGVSQQQSSDRTLTFRSHLGAVTIADLRIVK
jgi:hypothetical protein